MLAAPYVTLALSAFQLGAGIVVLFATVAFTLLVGIAEGRSREACESTQEIADDDGGELGPWDGRH